LSMNIQTNFEQARLNMVEQQIRPWEVLDQNVLDLITSVHREDFIPDEFRQLAFADVQLPLAHAQVTMTPKMEARLLQVVNVRKTDKVLEIGTGCAYLTALLAKSSTHTLSVDIYPEFTRAAEKKLVNHQINNATLVTGNAVNGWDKNNTYDVIVVTGSVPVLNTCFQEQLGLNGRLFVIVGNSPVMEAQLITRMGENEWSKEVLFETDLPPLIGVKTKEQFSL
jgi:protein-L-isoaspartate(D-aspartate) O-methyltransferase